VQGSVSILGAKIAAANPSVYHPVYAPRSHSLPIITGLKSKKTKSQVSILYLKNYRSGISQLDGICPFAASLFDSPPTTGSLVSRPKDLTFSILGDSLVPLARTQYPLSWQEAFQTISSAPAPSILVCGQKGNGKSTFCQFLGNSYIRRRNVMYLETDPGQPSFSPPGLVSLHSIDRPNLSPPFVRSGMSDLVRSHHIGNISPRDNPRHYINCIADLLSHDPRTTPTIINTPGWTKGTGFELLTSLIEISKPNFIVVLAPEGNDSLARSLHPFAAETQSHILVLESANTLAPALSLTAAEFRALGIMSYFHQIGFEKWDFKTHLTAWKPWVVKFSGPATDRGLHAIAIQGEELLLDDIVCAVNATMVAIILVSTTSDEEVTYTAEGIPVLSGRETPFMEPQRVRCVGYAFIRGIDSKRGELLLLSPWEPSSLQKGESVVLERGRVNLPVWGMWDHENPRQLGPWLERA
jgi:polynucleotide 5'-hydroxyl-kinase GRC3/NOL9